MRADRNDPTNPNGGFVKTLLRLFPGYILMAFAITGQPAFAQTKLLRFPDIYGDKVVFTYGGDLWVASTSGGGATRLTASPGVEVFAKFSPDGKWIAFTGQYDGDEQVYVIPSSGGEPRQLTFYPARGPLTPRWGYDNQVYGWTNDGKAVLFRSLKRYSGGQANDLFIFDLKTDDARRITDNPRADRDPMWIGNTIYFNSDRDGHFNLYAYDVAKGSTAQLITNKVWDVRWPSSDNEGRIVYELNGELQIFDTKSKKVTPLSITVPDDGLNRRPSRVNASNLISSFSLSPKGERALFAARGDVFTAPIEKGAPRNLTNSSNAHDKWPRWSPDASRIAFISDRTGEEEVWVVAQDGSKPAEQLTNGGRAMRYAPEWSPDGKYIAFGDKDGKVWALTVADKKLVEVAHSKYGQVQDYTWSPKGNYLAFTMQDTMSATSIYVWSSKDNQLRRVTTGTFNEFNPA